MAITWNYSDLLDNINALAPKVTTAVLMYAQTQSTDLTAKMKARRPWTDRTGMAKAQLNTTVSQPSNNIVRLTLQHGVDYGIWLELAHGKKYAILVPTVNLEGPRILEGLSNLLSRIH